MDYARFVLMAWIVAGGAVTGPESLSPKETDLDTRFLRDYAETRGFMLGRPVQAQPAPDGKTVLFLRAEARRPRLALYEFDVATATTRALLTPEQVLKGAAEKLSPEEKARRERMRVNVGGFTRFQISEDGSCLLVSLSGKLYVVDRAGGAVRELRTGPGTLLDPTFAPNGKSVGYVRDHDIYVYGLEDDHERRVTEGGTAQLTHGLAEFIAQEEMSRFSGYWWSPDSRQIAYEEADATGVETWYVCDPARPEQAPLATFYPRPGKANVAVRLGIAPVTGGKTVWVQWPAKEFPYLATVRWDKHGPLTLAVQSRDQHSLRLLAVEPATGRTQTLVDIHEPGWLNLHQEVPRWLAGGTQFLWVTQVEAGPQLELRERSSQHSPRVLVPAGEGYKGLVDVDAEHGSIVYRASPDPTQAQLFRMSLKECKPLALTPAGGLHEARFAKNHALYVHQVTTPEMMPVSTVHRADGSQVGVLPAVAQKPPFVPRAELVRVAKGQGFYAAVVRPRNFDAKQRYPVIVDVYGGPGHNKVTAAMGTRLLDQWLADQGFVVVSLDGRGTPGRGWQWEQAIGRHFGSVPLGDQVAGVRALGRRFPELDLERVGIVGWSFGGYLSALAVLRRPDVFKAAVAGAPVVDWLDYDTHYTERYLGLPDVNPEAYREASLLSYAAKLRRPLLVVHGTADDNVYFRHSLKLADALFRARRDFEMLPLSGLTHMVPDPIVTERLWSRIAVFFRNHLGSPSS
jgi:dipeptidyl-peptidase-4